jgi:hypothetical protein
MLNNILLSIVQSDHVSSLTQFKNFLLINRRKFNIHRLLAETYFIFRLVKQGLNLIKFKIGIIYVSFSYLNVWMVNCHFFNPLGNTLTIKCVFHVSNTKGICLQMYSLIVLKTGVTTH